MSATEAFSKALELKNAIRGRNFKKVLKLLKDPSVPVNLDFDGNGLPLMRMFGTVHLKKFLKNSRIDWLAPAGNHRRLLKLESEHGIQSEPGKLGDFSKSKLDCFYYLNPSFEWGRTGYAKKIYKRIIAELVKECPGECLDRLLFNTCNSLNAFKVALGYCSNIQARDWKGRSLLHVTRSAEVAELLIKSGLDVNALDQNEWSPLMTQASSNRHVIVKILMNANAKSDYINSKGQSFFTASLNKNHFLQNFNLSEEMFKAAMAKGSGLTDDLISEILSKYPTYRSAFESNFPLHLAALKDCHKSNYLEVLSKQDYLALLKDSRVRFETFKKLLEICRFNVSEYANELLHAAIENGNVGAVKLLLGKYQADALTGKPVLFSVNYDFQILKLLLAHGADPSLKIDGKSFFEQEGFFKKLSFQWFVEMYKHGINLAEFVQDQSMVVEFSNKTIKCSIPVSLIKEHADVLLCSDHVDLFAVVDQDGNTLLHYAALSFSKLQVRLDDLKQVKNAADQTPFDILINADKNFKFRMQISKVSDLAAYVKEYLLLQGDDILKRIGGKVVLKALAFKKKAGFELARFLIEEKEISLNRLIGSFRLITLIRRRIFDHKVMKWLLELGHVVDLDDFRSVCRDGSADTMKLFMENCQDLMVYADHLLNSCQELSEGIKYFYNHERIKNLVVAKGSIGNCTFLDQNFFLLAKDKQFFDYFLSIGAQPRNLIGTEIKAKVCLSAHYLRNWGWKHFLEQDGWKISDFKSILVEGNGTLFNYFVSVSFDFMKKYYVEDKEAEKRGLDVEESKMSSKNRCFIS